MNKKLEITERNLALEAVRVTEAAAILRKDAQAFNLAASSVAIRRPPYLAGQLLSGGQL